MSMTETNTSEANAPASSVTLTTSGINSLAAQKECLACGKPMAAADTVCAACGTKVAASVDEVETASVSIEIEVEDSAEEEAEMPEMEMPDDAEEASSLPTWESELAYEGLATSDGRYLIPGTIDQPRAPAVADVPDDHGRRARWRCRLRQADPDLARGQA